MQIPPRIATAFKRPVFYTFLSLLRRHFQPFRNPWFPFQSQAVALQKMLFPCPDPPEDCCRLWDLHNALFDLGITGIRAATLRSCLPFPPWLQLGSSSRYSKGDWATERIPPVGIRSRILEGKGGNKRTSFQVCGLRMFFFWD